MAPLTNDSKRNLERIKCDRAELAHFLNVRSRRPLGHGRFEFCERIGLTCRRELHDPVRPVPHPPGKSKLSRQLHHVPTKPDALHATPDLEMHVLHLALLPDSEQRCKSGGDRPGVGRRSGNWNRQLAVSDPLGDLLECRRDRLRRDTLLVLGGT